MLRTRGLLLLLAAALLISSATAETKADKYCKYAEKSFQGGMGATIHHDVVTFRVWAPHANCVFVAGDMNGWNNSEHPLGSEGNGFWSRDIPKDKVGAGSKYQWFIRNGDQELWKNDPYAREITNSVGQSIVHDPNAFDWSGHSFGTPAFNEQIIYELHTGTFTRDGYNPGKFQGIIDKIAYIKGLGINVVQLMPVFEFAGDQSWGYNPAHIFSIESAYGGSDMLKHLVKTCHANGIAVIVDVVINHLGPSDIDIWQFDGWSSGGGGIYFFQDWRKATPWGDRPDFARNEVRSWLKDSIDMLLNEYQIDGLRWDATAYVRNVDGGNGEFGSIGSGWTFMKWVNEDMNNRYPWKISIAEDLRGNHALTNGFDGCKFDSQWDGDFVHPVRHAIIEANDDNRSLTAIRNAITHNFNGDPMQRVIYTESHDEVANGKSRVPEEAWPGNAASWSARKRAAMGIFLTMTSPGIPMIFQGQEFAEDKYFDDSRGMDWGKLSSFGGKFYDMTRDLIRLRRNWHNTSNGLRGSNVNVHHMDHDNKVIAYHRWASGGKGDDVICILNMRDRQHDGYSIGVPSGGWWKVAFNGDWNAYGQDYGNAYVADATASQPGANGMSHKVSIRLGPYTGVILYRAD